MNININNLTINIQINGEPFEPPYDPSWDEDFPQDEVFPEEAAAAEKVLYEPGKVAPVEDYWDKAVNAAADPKLFRKGELVQITDGPLVFNGKVGWVTKDQAHDKASVLVEWEDWDDGHDLGPFPYPQMKQNRWFTMPSNLNKVEQWNS